MKSVGSLFAAFLLSSQAMAASLNYKCLTFLQDGSKRTPGSEEFSMEVEQPPTQDPNASGQKTEKAFSIQGIDYRVSLKMQNLVVGEKSVAPLLSLTVWVNNLTNASVVDQRAFLSYNQFDQTRAVVVNCDLQ